MIPVFYHRDSCFSKFIKAKFPHAIPVKSINECTSLKYSWYIDKDIWVDESFTLEYQIDNSEFKKLHQFKNNGVEGLYLVPYMYNFDQKDYSNKKVIESSVFSKIHYDIFFLSRGEDFAENNFQLLKNRFPFIKRVKDVKGIYAAHKVAAIQSSTDYFWVIDADSILLDNFNFNFKVHPYEFDIVHIWKSINNINDLEYGNGGVKLLPKFLFDIERTKTVDITTSLSDQIKIVDQTASIHNIGIDPFFAYRSAFREAAKLTLNNDAESLDRLKVWMNKGLTRKNGSYAIVGAKQGHKYAIEALNNDLKMQKINDYEWLHSRFAKEYPTIKIE